MASPVKRMRVPPGGPAGLLGERDAADLAGLAGKEGARAELDRLIASLVRLQNHLWAESRRAVLLVLQGMDAAGKDGTIRRVFTGVNPQGCVVSSFKAPTSIDLAYDYLWRLHLRVPARGEIGIWNRSHYEDLVTAHVIGVIDEAQRDRRIHHVREWERLLHDEGTTLVKVFLHISKDEQRARLQARLDDPEKRWKFNRDDLATRARWEEYQERYEHVLSQTSTDWAPWYVVPADHKWVRDVAVARLLVRALEALDPQVPAADPALDGLRVE